MKKTFHEAVAHDATQQNGSGPAPWPDPESLEHALLPVPAFEPRTMLPPSLAPWVVDIAERMQCPPDFIAVAALVVAATVIGRQLTIRPKRQDDWTVVPNLWGLVVGRPGLMKTPALREALKPLSRLTAEARLTFEQEQVAFTFRKAEAEARRKVMAKQLEKATATNEPVEHLRAAFEAPPPTPPTERRYLVNDSTVEKLGELLTQNPNGLLLFRDELTGWISTMDREGHENDRAFYCEAWNGTGSYTYDRVGRGTLHIPAACVSVLGGIQPGPLQSYLREAFAESRADGFVQRFQLAVFPDVGRTWHHVDRWPDRDEKTRAWDVLRHLADLDLQALGAHHLSPDELPFLRFSDEAQALFDTWRATLETRLRADDEHPVLIAHLSKYRSLVPSLALILHLLACVPDQGGPVSAPAVTQALAWCTYLEAHARRIYQTVVARTRVTAIALAAKLRLLSNPFTARMIHRAEWAGLDDREAVGLALGLLEDLHWLRAEDVRPEGGGRPTVHYHVNPGVLSR